MSPLAMQDGALLFCDGALSTECCEPGDGDDDGGVGDPQCFLPNMATLDPQGQCEKNCPNEFRVDIIGIEMHVHQDPFDPDSPELPICPHPMDVIAYPMFFSGTFFIPCRWSHGISQTICSGPGQTDHVRALFPAVVHNNLVDDNGDPIGTYWVFRIFIKRNDVPQGTTMIWGQEGIGDECPPSTDWEYCGYGSGGHGLHVNQSGTVTITPA